MESETGALISKMPNTKERIQKVELIKLPKEELFGQTGPDSAEDQGHNKHQSEVHQMSSSASTSDMSKHGSNGKKRTIFSHTDQISYTNPINDNKVHTESMFETMLAEENSKITDSEPMVLKEKSSCHGAVKEVNMEKQIDQGCSDSLESKYFLIESYMQSHPANKDSAERLNTMITIEDADAVTSTRCTNSHTIETSYRVKPPLNWFPRRRTESYLERKIRMLQEKEGMNATLDETLGGSNPHLSRIEREKLAAQVAAGAAMEARKAALVEASWCRILKAARIPCELAEVQLKNAEKRATEAFDAAAALGVIMHNKPGGSIQSLEVETSTANGSQTHTVSASFQTAFEVDKEVAGAVKQAFFRLAHLPTSAIKGIFDVSHDAYSSLSIKMDENDTALDNDSVGADGMLSTASSECEAQNEDEQQTYSNLQTDTKITVTHAKCVQIEKNVPKEAFHKCKNHSKHSQSKQEPATEAGISEELIDQMLERVKLLKEEELVSLAMIVATSGLSAMLKEEENKEQELNVKCNPEGLGDILVKHISRLEAEKAAFASKAVLETQGPIKKPPTESLIDLGSILVKHISKLEREVQEARNLAKPMQSERKNLIVEGENPSKISQPKGGLSQKPSMETSTDLFEESNNNDNKENRYVNTSSSGTGHVKHVTTQFRNDFQETHNLSEDDQGLHTKQHSYVENHDEGLDKVLVKHISRLEKEKMAALTSERESCKRVQRNQYQCDSLDKILVKHVSKLQKEKLTAAQEGTHHSVQRNCQNDVKSEDSLDKILVKHVSRLEKLKISAAQEASHSVVSNSEHPDVKSEDSLDKILIKHVSKLEREKMESGKETFQRVQRKKNHHDENCIGSLDDVLVKHVSKLEKEKMAAALEGSHTVQKTSQHHVEDGLDTVLIKHISKSERNEMEADQQAFQRIQKRRNDHDENSWGSLDEVLVKHVSKLEKVKIAAEQEASYTLERNSQQHDVKIEDGLDKILIKHISKLEREKMETGKEEFKKIQKNQHDHSEDNWGSLDQVLVKHVSKLEKVKIAAAQEASHSVQRNSQPYDVKTEEGLDKVLIKHTTKLEREKMETRQEVFKRVQKKQHCKGEDSWGTLDQVLIKHVSKLEKEKLRASTKETSQEFEKIPSVSFNQAEDRNNSILQRQRNARVQEMQEQWGGLSLGKSLRPHLTKLELEKAAWLQAEEAELKRSSQY